VAGGAREGVVAEQVRVRQRLGGCGDVVVARGLAEGVSEERPRS
jgi:hypothetical protein